MDLLAFLRPIEWVVAWTLYIFHDGLTRLGLKPESGAAWGLSIVGLVLVMRILLIPLFVKQIKASRGMQLLTPELQAIQKKYKGKTDPASREEMGRETMELYKKHGTTPMASCLPVLAQSPIFFALFRVLNALKPLAEGTYMGGNVQAIGPIDQMVARQAESSTIFGAKLSDTFMQTSEFAPRAVTVALIILMSATSFFTQRQLTMKNMPPSALEGPMAKQQKMMMYMLPLIFAFSGVNFPIGVLIYWSTTNIWSMGQQFFIITRNPTPGSEAAKRREERLRRKHPERFAQETALIEEPRGQRAQPKRKSRAQRRQAARAEEASKDSADTTEELGDSSPRDNEGETGETAETEDLDQAKSTEEQQAKSAPKPKPSGQRTQPRKRKRKKKR
jgi:YidC/Oxa1 family membrane protein insertase